MKKIMKSDFELALRNTNALSGTPKILMRHAKSLIHLGHNVSVMSENFHPTLKENPLYECRKLWKWPKSTLFQRKFFDWQVKRKKRQDSFLIGHGDCLDQDLLFMHTCVHKGAEVAPGPHNDKNLSLPFHRMIFEQGSFKRVVCVTHFMKDDLQKRFNIQVPMSVIHPGHDKNIVKQVEMAKVQELKKQLGVLDGELVVAVIASGNLLNRGAFALLEAIGQLEENLKNKIRILIVGKEGRPEKIYDLALKVQMRERVLWIPPRKDVANLISSADVVVHAANIEASGLTFLEFMALARPVIATKTVGFSEILPDIQKPFVIERQDPKLIAPKLRELLLDEDLRLRLGMANQEVAKNLTWEAYDKQFEELVTEMLTEKFQA